MFIFAGLLAQQKNEAVNGRAKPACQASNQLEEKTEETERPCVSIRPKELNVMTMYVGAPHNLKAKSREPRDP